MSPCFPRFALLLGAAALVFSTQAALGSAVKVAKSGQGIYAKADETKKVATLPVGTVMEVRSVVGGVQGWVQVAAPACVDLWIFSESVNNDIVTVSTGRVRSSQNSTAPEVARIPRGGAVVVRGREGDWLKIAPPSSATMWVKAESVVPTTEVPARVEETSVAVASSKSAAPVILPPMIPSIPTTAAVTAPTPEPPAPTPEPLPLTPSAPAPSPVALEPKPDTTEVVASTPPVQMPAPVVTAQPPSPAPSASSTPATTSATIVPTRQPPETTEVQPAPAKTADKPAKTEDKPTPAKPVAVTTTTKPVAVTTTTRQASRPVRTTSTPAPVAPSKVSAPAAATPVASTSKTKTNPASTASKSRTTHPAKTASVASDLAGIGPTQTHLPRIENDADWDDPTPGTLLPNRRHPVIVGRVPEAIAEENLSPTFVQGKAGRVVGTLVRDEGGFFHGSRYEVYSVSENGDLFARLAIIVGDEAALSPLVNRTVRIDGTVWWLRSSTPYLAVETIAPLR